ncbi:MAG TPA: VirB8/TrbF family protein [Allosphingosinicella sp.]|nr:VirB8/TrbF family protein [Allosphingosinicella sp.]
MNEQNREALDAYYKDAATWNRDRLEALHKSQRTAWWVAIGAATIAVLEAGALILLTPLKTVEPYTLLVDRTTGYVQALKPLEADKVAPDAALTQSFLVQYVIARESFDIDMVTANYNKVALWSAEQARSGYLNSVQVSNPQSPLVIYPRSTVVETRVKSVSPLGRNVALVRFDTIRSDAGGQVQPPRSWVAVIRYRYTGEPMKLEDRFVNPLGFRVVRYRVDPESAPPPAAVMVTPVPVEVVSGSSTTVTTTTTGPGGAPLGDAAAAAARAAEQRRRNRPPEPEL